MTFDQDVLKFSKTATQVNKREAIAIFSQWRDTFSHDDPSRFGGRVLRGTSALLEFGAKESEEFYALFEYQQQKIPVTYHCFGLHTGALPLEGRDIAIVDFKNGWCIVFYHEDGLLTDGPCYYETTEPAAAPDRR